jgi:hypothetical protein
MDGRADRFTARMSRHYPPQTESETNPTRRRRDLLLAEQVRGPAEFGAPSRLQGRSQPSLEICLGSPAASIASGPMFDRRA